MPSPSGSASAAGWCRAWMYTLYMVHAPVAFWGRAWLERGFAECRFLSPVYDGDEVVVLADETADGLGLQANSGARSCATG